jgi:hypothetical protein
VLGIALLAAAVVALAIPAGAPAAEPAGDEPEHGELAILAGGTVVGLKSE